MYYTEYNAVKAGLPRANFTKLGNLNVWVVWKTCTQLINIYKFILTHSSRRLVPWSLSSVLRSVAAHTPWPKVTVYYMMRKERWERKGPQIPFRGMPPSKRFHHHLSTGPHGQPNLQDMGLWDWNQLSVVPGSRGKGISLRYTRSHLKEQNECASSGKRPESSEPLQNRKELEKRHRAYISISQEFVLK